MRRIYHHTLSLGGRQMSASQYALIKKKKKSALNPIESTVAGGDDLHISRLLMAPAFTFSSRPR